MTLIKTSLLNAIAVAIKMLTLLGINKVLAIYVGPAGYAALGQFQNAIQMVTTFASGAINTGVTKYTAEYYDDESKQQSVWRTAGTIAVIGSSITAIVVTLFNQPLALLVFKNRAYGGVFIWLAVSLIFLSYNTLLLAILNGKKEVGFYVVANIAGSCFSFLFTTVMVVSWGLYGALVSMATYQAVSFFITILVCRKMHWFRIGNLFGRTDKGVVINLFKYAAMALTSAVCGPVSHMLVRGYLGEKFGWEAAGYWEAMWRLSGAYLLLVTTTLSVYYLPRLSEIKNPIDIKSEILKGYQVILPVVMICGILMYVLKDYIIITLFSEEFLFVRSLFGWQVIGDVLKIGSWILAFVMLSKSLVALYIFSEVFFSLLFVLATMFFSERLGVVGSVVSHALVYLLYWMFIAYFLLTRYFPKFQGGANVQ